MLTFIFLERHWALVTTRLSTVLTQDLSAIIDIYQSYPQDADEADADKRIAQERMNIDIEFLPKGPAAAGVAEAVLLDRRRARSRTKSAGRSTGPSGSTPSGARTSSRSVSSFRPLDSSRGRLPQRRLCFELLHFHPLDGRHVLRADLRRRHLPADSQIRPILRLSRAAEAFGKGRDIEFRPRGAREVRQAGYAFIAMKRRIERAIEQRTAMLNGVSHDLRTVITRFKLSLALMGDNEDSDEMKKRRRGDAADGRRLPRVRPRRRQRSPRSPWTCGSSSTRSRPTPTAMAATLCVDCYVGEPNVRVRPDAFRRCVGNLVGNAQAATARAGQARRYVRDAPFPDDPCRRRRSRHSGRERRVDVFRPFVRLDEARNQDAGGTGLGLSIARDIARSHGGDITLGDSPLGGLRATVRVPV